LKLYQHRSYVLALENAATVNGMYVDESDKGLSLRSYGSLLLLGGGGHRTGKKGGTWRELEAFTKKHYPDAVIRHRWATQDCMSLDGVPYIGPYSRRTEGLYVATGFNKWGMTSSMVAAELLAEKLTENGCAKVVLNDLARCDMAEAVEDAFRYGKLVLATTTYNGDIFPFMREFINHLTERSYKNRTVGLMENGSWAPTAAKTMRKMLEGSKDLTFTDTTVKILSALNDDSRAQIEALARELCK
jgi:hypothetical protein